MEILCGIWLLLDHYKNLKNTSSHRIFNSDENGGNIVLPPYCEAPESGRMGREWVVMSAKERGGNKRSSAVFFPLPFFMRGGVGIDWKIFSFSTLLPMHYGEVEKMGSKVANFKPLHLCGYQSESSKILHIAPSTPQVPKWIQLWKTNIWKIRRKKPVGFFAQVNIGLKKSSRKKIHFL